MDNAILENLPSLLKTGEFSDMSITCSDGSQVRCHKAIISLASFELRGTLVSTTSTPAIRLISNAPRENVLELLGILYGRKPNLTSANFTFIFKVSKLYKMQALQKAAVTWFKENVNQILCLDLIVSANKLRAQGEKEIYDLINDAESYKHLTIECVPNGLMIESIDIPMFRKILSESVFTSVSVKINLIIQWLDSESNSGHIEILLNDYVRDETAIRILKEDGDSFIQIKEDILKLCEKDDKLYQTMENVFKKALSQGYITSILSGNFREIVESVDSNKIRVLISADEIRNDENFKMLEFIMFWKESSGCDDATAAKLANICVSCVDIKQLFAKNGKLFSKIRENVTDPQVITKFEGSFNEFCTELSTFKKLQKQASCERWGEFSFSEILKLWSLYPDDLDEFNLIGMFLQWAIKNRDMTAHSIAQLPKVSGSVCERFLSDACAIVDKEFNLHKICRVADFKNSNIANKEFEVFYDGMFPLEEEQQIDSSLDVTMATFKRQSGQFTQGSRIMVFKNGSRVIRIGFDRSRIPNLYKYQMSYGRSRSFSQKSDSSSSKDDIDQIDVTGNFATIYGVLDSGMINIPYLDLDTIEGMIARIRADNKPLKIVVIARR